MTNKNKIASQEFKQALQDVEALGIFRHPAQLWMLDYMDKASRDITSWDLESCSRHRSFQVERVTNSETMAALKRMVEVGFLQDVQAMEKKGVTFAFRPAHIVSIAQLFRLISKDGDSPAEGPCLMGTISLMLENDFDF